MKGIKLLLAVCLALPAFGAARADDLADTVRAAVRRIGTSATQLTRQKSTPAPTTTSTRGASATSKAAPTNTRLSPSSGTTRTVATPDNTRGDASGTVSARTASGTSARATDTPNTTARTAVARTTVTPRTAARTATQPANTRSINKSRAALSPTRASTRARTASSGLTRADILTRDYSKCKTVYHDCMDEFCANKDAQLKRCACSSRVNEFDRVKKQLAEVDEQMLNFSQRLLTVNMDKEDAAVLNQATEGEIAFNQKDTSASKKMLDEIAKKLNTSFNDSNFDQGLNAISLSLNMDAAFDTVDSLAGASTTLKTGVALYNAALPVCREMAAEVCTPDELDIVTSGYQMTIEQDCNTVFKTYQTQTDQARERLREGSALLDMSRLDIHQKRNSDDILTCKEKMLDMLTDSTVCGAGLGKCLDTSGQYIDPTTGQAFLTPNLVNLANLIVRPTSDDENWRSIPNNSVFVTYLNSKKKFLAPAMEKCQDIADHVWEEFVEDALGQIKLAQDAKLEEVRQSCTTLTTQCLSEANDSIEEFDARALSTFGVWADKTVAGMCSAVKTACTALLDQTDTDKDWSTGMGDISTDITYDTILATCREVGRACFIQVCKSTSGNFGLCESIDNSVNRKAILRRTACWKEVYDCINTAGDQKIADIYNRLGVTANAGSSPFLSEMYGTTSTSPIYDLCTIPGPNGESTPCGSGVECQKCRMLEQIWGNCQRPPETILDDGEENKIIIPQGKNISNTNTLLAWFAVNTGTSTEPDSCRDTMCGPGYIQQQSSDGSIVCVAKDAITPGDKATCSGLPRVEPPHGQANCCSISGAPAPKDSIENCCMSGKTATLDGYKVCVPSSVTDTELTPYTSFSVPDATGYYVFDTDYSLVCIGGTVGAGDNAGQVKCNGKWLLVTSDGRAMSPQYTNGASAGPRATYKNNGGEETYTLTFTTDGKWQWVELNNKASPTDATQSDKSLLYYD